MVVHHKSCGCVAYIDTEDGREFLLLHYPGGHWDFPKGHVEDSDESEIATAVRELKEETDLDPLRVLPGFMTTMSYSYTIDGKKHEKVVDYFIAQVGSKEVKLSHEHKGFVWKNFQDSLKHLTYDNARDVLIAVEGFLKSCE